VIVSGPIASCLADLTLLYAVMGNANYPNADLRKPGAAALCLPGAEAAAAAAAAAPLRPLALPDVLVPVPEDAAHSGSQVDLVDLAPLKGLRVGVFPQVSHSWGCALLLLGGSQVLRRARAADPL
jgi:hypothetical protein